MRSRLVSVTKIDFEKFKLQIFWLLMVIVAHSVLQPQAFAEETLPDLQPLGITEHTTAIVGTPKSQVISNGEATSRKVLSKEEAKNVSLQIVQVDGKFFWASRGNIELRHHVAGAFDYFDTSDGAGYIKVFRMDGKALYMEHVHMWLGTYTYWGEMEVHEQVR